MNKIKTLCVALLTICTLQLSAAEYKASLFGARSDGHTLNTRTIQKAVDYIAEQGGGTLVFYVGRYLTGTVYLKSNVSIRLEEGAILVASDSPYDYKGVNGVNALIVAQGVDNVGITGKGVIEGHGASVIMGISAQVTIGHMDTPIYPALIYMTNCKSINIDGITLNDAASDVQVYDKCTDLMVNNVTTTSLVAPKSIGIKLTGSQDVTITKSVFNTSGTPVEVDAASKRVAVTECMDLAKGKKLQLKK